MKVQVGPGSFQTIKSLGISSLICYSRLWIWARSILTSFAQARPLHGPISTRTDTQPALSVPRPYLALPFLSAISFNTSPLFILGSYDSKRTFNRGRTARGPQPVRGAPQFCLRLQHYRDLLCGS